jgi:hypothetical protein
MPIADVAAACTNAPSLCLCVIKMPPWLPLLLVANILGTSPLL